jgi:hypothetical protein
MEHGKVDQEEMRATRPACGRDWWTEVSSLINRMLGAGGRVARALLGTTLLLRSHQPGLGAGGGDTTGTGEVVANESLAVPGSCRPQCSLPEDQLIHLEGGWATNDESSQQPPGPAEPHTQLTTEQEAWGRAGGPTPAIGLASFPPALAGAGTS